jgi:methylated-DNA-[protein]-cysteine S-methyltransferase
MTVSWARVDTDVGPVSVGCTEVGVAEVRFGPVPAQAPAGPDAPWAATAREQISEYFAGDRTAFELPLDWRDCSGSRLAVLTLLAETVGFGETVSYGALSQRLAERDGRPELGARAIGAIMGSNPIPLIVPCHRVVAADGLGGFSGGCGIELKRWLLTFEGALPAMLELDFGSLTSPGRGVPAR